MADAVRLILSLPAVLLLTGCAHARPSLCHAFDARDFYRGESGVSAGGDLLIYSQPSVDCGQRPEWRARMAPRP